MCRAVSLQSPVAMGTLKIHRLLWLFHSPKAHTFLCNNLHLQLWPRPNGEDAWCFQNPHVMFFIWFDILDVYLYIYIQDLSGGFWDVLRLSTNPLPQESEPMDLWYRSASPSAFGSRLFALVVLRAPLCHRTQMTYAELLKQIDEKRVPQMLEYLSNGA